MLNIVMCLYGVESFLIKVLLNFYLIRKSKNEFKIRIVGTCVDSELDKRIKKLTNSNVVYENRRASFGEIAKQVCLSKYVLFPYVGNSISSSGALIDTLVLVELLLVLIKVHLKIWRKKVYVLRIKMKKTWLQYCDLLPKN